MEKNKISSLKDLDLIRQEILNSAFTDYPDRIKSLENAYQIAQSAPLRIMKRYDGYEFDNHDERNSLLTMLKHDVEYAHTLTAPNFEFWKFQVVSTIFMLMISITEGGDDLDKILNS